MLPDVSEIRAALARVLGDGVRFEVSRREQRWLALGDELVAFVADDEAGWDRLCAEGALLGCWRGAGIPAPALLAEVPELRIQVRGRLHGLVGDGVEERLFGEPRDSVARYDARAPITPFGERLAESYGTLAARIAAVAPPEVVVRALGRREAVDVARAEGLLRAYGAGEGALAALDRARGWLSASDPEAVVIHGDLHFYNLCLSPEGEIVGVFDLDSAGLDERWTDLQYLHSLGPRFVERALAAYRAVSGRQVDEDAVRRRHVLVAIDHVRWHPPGAARHASVLAWASEALVNLAP